MKKILSIVMILAMLLGLAACGPINKTEVSILWSGKDAVAVIPNSLINAMDRAMYIENISYKHYAANGDQAAQTKQAEESLNAGCSALMVELVDPAAAQTIVDLAKAKNVPVIFFGCTVDASVISGYEKCALVNTDEESLPVTLAQAIVTALVDNKKGADIDSNNDGKISYVALGDVAAAVEKINAVVGANLILEEVAISLDALVAGTKIKDGTEYGAMETSAHEPVELIIAASDEDALKALVKLQGMGFNKDKLTTHYVNIFTVGADADYKAHVLAGLPTDESKKAEYLQSMLHLVDMVSVEEKDWDKMIYNTLNQISAGKISGTVLPDFDKLATNAAHILAQLLKGQTVAEKTVLLPYTMNLG